MMNRSDSRVDSLVVQAQSNHLNQHCNIPLIQSRLESVENSLKCGFRRQSKKNKDCLKSSDPSDDAIFSLQDP
jgi:hypothetical protein